MNIKRKKHLAFVVMVALLVTIFTGCAEDEESSTTTPAPTTLPPGYLTYTNTTEGLRIMYPPDWEKMEAYMNTVVLFRSPPEDDSDIFQENLNIVTGETEPMDIGDFTDANIDEIEQSFPGVEILERGSATLAGNPAKKVLFGLVQGQYDLRLLQLYTIKGSTAYVITYTAEKDTYDEYLETAQTMINTFEIIED
jgi:serine/threonine-protein kinase